MQKITIEMFNESADSYDERYAQMGAIKDALHLLTKSILADLPENAHVLCVGAGTGQEIMYLAEAFPTWHFTAVEPASAMMDICKKKAAQKGIASRCNFHEGFIETLPKTTPFHAATSILVSQFMTDKKERQAFFQEIAARLGQGGILINVDLSADMNAAYFKNLYEVWTKFQDITPDQGEKMLSQWKEKVAVVPVQEVEKIISTSGFGPAVLFYQALFIHGWYAQLS